MPIMASAHKDHKSDAWQIAPLQHFNEVSMLRFPHELSEPLFIPRLQSRFADFPWPRSLLTRGFSPRRPDAVISTAPARVARPSLRRRPAPPAPAYASVFSPEAVLLAPSASARPLALSRDDGPAGWTGRQWAAPSVANAGQACRDLSLLPFRRLCGRGRALRTESPADRFGGRGILLLFSGLYAG